MPTASPSPDLNLIRSAMKRRSVGFQSARRITDLERRRTGNQVFFNGFSRGFKCGLRVEIADLFGVIAEPSSGHR